MAGCFFVQQPALLIGSTRLRCLRNQLEQLYRVFIVAIARLVDGAAVSNGCLAMLLAWYWVCTGFFFKSNLDALNWGLYEGLD